MSADHIRDLLVEYGTEGVILDTNLLLLYAIGIYDPNRIATFKNTMKYTAEDFVLLSRLLSFVDRRVVTPNILTEVDNLGRQLRANEYEAFSLVFSELCNTTFEVYRTSREASTSAYYCPLGLTDAITLELAKDKLLTITDDFELSNRLAHLGFDAININHIRGYLLS